MTLLGQEPVRCKIIVDDKCLEYVRNFKYLGCEIPYENGKDSQQKVSKFAQILRILNDNFQQILVYKFWRIKKIYDAHPQFFYMEAKFGPLTKGLKKDLNQSR